MSEADIDALIDEWTAFKTECEERNAVDHNLLWRLAVRMSKALTALDNLTDKAELMEKIESLKACGEYTDEDTIKFAAYDTILTMIKGE